MAGTFQADSYLNSAGTGAPNFPQGLTASTAMTAQFDNITNAAGTGAPTFPYGIKASQAGTIAANDSNVVFTSTSNTYQLCTPTAARTYTMPASLTAGVPWIFYNQATSGANYITLQTSNANAICIVPPLGYAIIVPTSATPTAKANWFLQDRQSQWVLNSPVITYTGLGTVSGNSSNSKLINDVLYVAGSVTVNTATGVLATANIPYSLIIDTAKSYLAGSTAGACCKVGSWGQPALNCAGYTLIATTTSSLLTYFGGNIVSANVMTPQLGNTYFANSTLLNYDYQVFVTL